MKGEHHKKWEHKRGEKNEHHKKWEHKAGPCMKLAKEKCEQGDKKCFWKVVKGCRAMAKNPCVQKVMAKCKEAEEPKKCFMTHIKECKHEKQQEKEDALLELNKLHKLKKFLGDDNDKKKACAMKIKKAGWCKKAKDPKKCWAGKMKWCMSQKKEEELFLF